LIEGKETPKKAARVVLPPELVIRSSCGASPATGENRAGGKVLRYSVKR
jgi:hypothetical protein